MPVKSLYILILTLFFCFDASSQQKYKNPKLYEIEESGKVLIGELKYEEAKKVFESAKKTIYRPSVDEISSFDNFIKNTDKLRSCVNEAMLFEQRDDIEKALNKYKDCKAIFSSVQIKSIDTKIQKYAIDAVALELIQRGDDIKDDDLEGAKIWYQKAIEVKGIDDKIKARAEKRIRNVDNLIVKKQNTSPRGVQTGTNSITSTKETKYRSVDFHANAMIGNPIIFVNSEQVITRTPTFNAETGFGITKLNQSSDLSIGLSYLKYSFATMGENEKDAESFNFEYLKLNLSGKWFKKGKNSHPYFKLEPFFLFPLSTKYQNYYTNTVYNSDISNYIKNRKSSIENIGSGVSLGVGFEMQSKTFGFGIEPFIMGSTNFINANAVNQDLSNPTQLKSSLFGYGMKVYLRFGTFRQ